MGIVCKPLPIVTLVKVETCFVAFPDVHKEATKPFFNEQEVGRRFSPEGARAGLKTFLKTDVDIRPLIDPCRRKDLLKLMDDLVFPAL
jgi:hypothetical protein